MLTLNYVTIASDASCGENSTGYAYYIRDDDGTTKHAWRSDHKKLSSTKAEIVAALSALKVVSRRNYPAGTKIIYYCDNTTALKIIKDDFSEKTRKKYAGAIEMAQSFIGDMEIETRHVPAHTGKDDQKRYYLNRWCDFNARAMMKYNRLHRTRRRGLYIK
ncbi:MAG: RNase H family protein [Candidatus Saccharimonadaceae bacterium]